MGCCCCKAAEPPEELVGLWSRDPDGSLHSLAATRMGLYERTYMGWVNSDLGPPNEVLEVTERGVTSHMETFGGGHYSSWVGNVLEWRPLGPPGGVDYVTTTCCCGTLRSVTGAMTASGKEWSPRCTEPVHSILVNGSTRLYRVQGFPLARHPGCCRVQ